MNCPNSESPEDSAYQTLVAKFTYICNRFNTPLDQRLKEGYDRVIKDSETSDKHHRWRGFKFRDQVVTHVHRLRSPIVALNSRIGIVAINAKWLKGYLRLEPEWLGIKTSMITLYDVASKIPDMTTWSPNTWKARYVLDFKRLPYKLIAVEYYDIEKTLKDAGVQPTGKRNDDSDLYTVPSIVDSNTGAKVSDSIKIALYLEETYPETPSIFPHNSAALHQAFFTYFNTTITSIWSTILPRIPEILDERAKTHYIALRTKTLGRPLAEIDPVGEERDDLFRKMKDAFTMFDGFYQKNGRGMFIMGDSPGFADLMIGGVVQGLKVWGMESPEWREFSTWNGGRWVKLLDALENNGE
ncbi:hypothetical protein AN958_01511 [Leucoagaricus sp. SymC.cos]|nr:hypothetical protein AN958_01511 [Leucoagaricus sp. SymC.cos]